MQSRLDININDLKRLALNYLKEHVDKKLITVQEQCENDPLESVQIVRYDLKSISDHPLGFLANHQYLYLEFEQNLYSNLYCEYQLRFFIKSLPLNIPSRMIYLDQFGVFRKEIQFYMEILPNLNEIFDPVAAKCFYAINNHLIFEDLTNLGYRLAAKRDGLLTIEHIRCTIKTLANLHVASLLYEMKDPIKFHHTVTNILVENSYPINVRENHVRKVNFTQALIVCEELIKQMPKYEKELQIILPQLKIVMENIFTFSQTSKKYRNVISHGDLWANNIMFNYDKITQQPIHCRFVDFQLARYAPPMLDLITILTISTTRQFRSKYLNNLLEFYYETITKLLLKFKLSINDFLPLNEFNDTFKLFRVFGLIESFLFSHLIMLPTELTQNLITSTDGFNDFFQHKRVTICLTAFQKDAIYRSRLTDMLEDLIDNFIL